MRPDEEASQAEIKRVSELRGNLKKGASAALTAVSAVGGAKIISRLLPFLNENLPVDIALRGINKISPKLGKLLRKGQDMGLDIKDGLNYLRSKPDANEAQENEQPNFPHEPEMLAKPTPRPDQAPQGIKQILEQEKKAVASQSNNMGDDPLLAAIQKILSM